MELNRPIALVGMMGAGKTSFGKKIAKKIDAKFFDCDAHIKMRTGYTPKEIFNYFGETMLKETEFLIIQELAKNGNAIISTGDSLIDNKKAWEFLRQNAITIWLNIDLKLISARLRPNDDRPYLDEKKDESIFKFLTQLYKKRAQKYRQAHLIIHKPILHKKTFLKKLKQILEQLQTSENLNINIELANIEQLEGENFPIVNTETNLIELPNESINNEAVKPKFKSTETPQKPAKNVQKKQYFRKFRPKNQDQKNQEKSTEIKQNQPKKTYFPKKTEQNSKNPEKQRTFFRTKPKKPNQNHQNSSV